MTQQNQVPEITEQAKVKKQLAKIIQIFATTQGAVRPHFMLTGPSGSGKSHIMKVLAMESQLGFLEINAAQLTKEGTSGNSLSKALTPLLNMDQQLVICFVDEFDKLFISGNNNGILAHETTNGVQNEFLKVLESSTTSVFGDYGKFVEASVENVLFVFGGAFNGAPDIGIEELRDYGIKTEFLGRVGLVYNLEKLSVDSMYVALQNSDLLANYLMLFPEIKRPDVENAIMTEVARLHDKNTLGIRLLNSLLNQYFINDGKLDSGEVIQQSFKKTLSFEK